MAADETMEPPPRDADRGDARRRTGAGHNTVYTIYSTRDPESIGTGETSGFTGLLTQDMLDLYARTPVKTKVIMLPA